MRYDCTVDHFGPINNILFETDETISTNVFVEITTLASNPVGAVINLVSITKTFAT